MNTRWLGRVVAPIATILFLMPAAWAQYIETDDPNQLCSQAQSVGVLSTFPADLSGGLVLTGGDPPGDVDFFAFQATGGMRLRAQLLGSPSGSGTLVDPYLGLFDSQCGLLAANDDYQSVESRLEFEVPADGTFILAATGCCDGSFEGFHGWEGTYLLVLSEPPVPIQAITGRVVDGVTGQPLPGNVPPYAWAELRQCDEFGGCYRWMNNLQADEFGAFRFETDWAGNPLEPGDYVVALSADGYQPAEVGPFHVAAGEVYDLGDVPLLLPPFVFMNVVPCADIPPGGGTCKYSVDVRNNTKGVVHGLGWSLVNAYGSSPWGWTIFQADKVNRLRVPALSSRTLSFSFDVPAGVADDTFMCAEAWFSDRETQFFGTLRAESLFCVMKQSGSLQIVEPKAAAAKLGVASVGSGTHGPSAKSR